MAFYTSKEDEIVAYDYYTDLKHSSYYNVPSAARILGIEPKDIMRSIKDKSYTASGHYFKVEPRKNFKKERRGRLVTTGKIKSI